MVKKKEYVSAGSFDSEFSVASLILGVLISVIFGAANAYLGLRVGLTISASIPAAVISMSVMHFLLRRSSVLESNMVQTIGSAGESLAAGVVFVLPAFFMMKTEGMVSANPSLLKVTVLALCGGILGVLFMIPLREALIVRERCNLPFPEGKACAEVLLVGRDRASSSSGIFLGILFSTVAKFLIDGFKVVSDTIAVNLKFLNTKIASEVYPSLISVGYICGLRVSLIMLAGGVIGWLVLIPLIVQFGGGSIIGPSTIPVSQVYAEGGADAIWKNYIRYIGAGTVAVGGVISILKSLPLIVRTFYSTIKSASKGSVSTDPRNKDLDIKVVGLIVLAVLFAMHFIPQVQIPLVGVLLVVIFGFFFSTVTSKMTGLVGSTNNPISGMTIATIIVASGILRSLGYAGTSAMMLVLSIGAIVCIISAIAGDTAQDLNTGYLVGATPRKQQIGELIGVVFSALSIGYILILLNEAWQFGSDTIPAPQATLMKLIAQGGINGDLPWTLIFVGGAVSIAFELAGINSIPMAIGLYLPLEITAPLAFGGCVRAITDWIKNKAKNKKAESNTDKISKESENNADGAVLFCSGIIAGEGLVGILLAVFAVVGFNIDFSSRLSLGIAGSVLLLLLTLALIFYYGTRDIKCAEKEKGK
jgi:putative OPT family oligopeptide transporter